MPRQPFEQYYSEKELHEMVNRINAFASDYSPWKFTHARKEHQDLFGEVIKPGEHYFKHERGSAFDDVVKLQILEQRQKRMLEAMSKLSFMGNRKHEKGDPSGAKRNR